MYFLFFVLFYLEELLLEELALVELDNSVVVADELAVGEEEGVDGPLPALVPDGLAGLDVDEVEVDDLGLSAGVGLDDGGEAGGLLGDEHLADGGGVDDDVLAHFFDVFYLKGSGKCVVIKEKYNNNNNKLKINLKIK